jgi:hypothetical protein
MRPLAVLLLSFSLTALAVAQNPVPTFTVRMAPVTQPHDTVQRSACEAALAGLRSLGVQVTDTLSDYVVYVDACIEGGRGAGSVWLCHVLPPEAVAACARAEVFYAGVSPERRAAFPAEGKWVREKVTADYVREFIMPLESRIVMGLPDRLNQAIQHQVEEVVRPLTMR